MAENNDLKQRLRKRIRKARKLISDARKLLRKYGRATN